MTFGCNDSDYDQDACVFEATGDGFVAYFSSYDTD